MNGRAEPPIYGQCSRCGGALHSCLLMAPEVPETSMKASRLSQAIRIYTAASRIENKELAAAWSCSESTVSRFLSGKQWPDGQTICRIVSWLMDVQP